MVIRRESHILRSTLWKQSPGFSRCMDRMNGCVYAPKNHVWGGAGVISRKTGRRLLQEFTIVTKVDGGFTKKEGGTM